MSDNWIVQNLNSALSTWSEKMAELWTLLTENPATFKGGGIWRIMTNINDALTAIAYCKMMGIELPKEKPKKVKKQSRGKER